MNTTSENQFYINLKQKRESQGIEITEISEQTNCPSRQKYQEDHLSIQIQKMLHARFQLK